VSVDTSDRKALEDLQTESRESSPSGSDSDLYPITPSISREVSISLSSDGDSFATGVSLPDVQRDGSGEKNSSAGKEKQKQKRTRATPEQLVRLERFFSLERNPNGARRKEISELLGMPQRQVQIWFQNRSGKLFISEQFFEVLIPSHSGERKQKCRMANKVHGDICLPPILQPHIINAYNAPALIHPCRYTI
jgi:hypothetical protein